MIDEPVHRKVLSGELRMAMGLLKVSQSEMARRTGISVMTVSRHWRGAGPISAYQQQAYATALGTFWFLDDAGLPRLDSNQQPADSQTQPEPMLARVAS